jgi:hypothetical protein
LDEGGDRLLIKGTGNKAGTATFRMCGLKHSAGRFEARGAINSWPYTDSTCNPVPGPASAAGVDRACSYAAGSGRDRETFSASFKRPTRITLAIADCRYYTAISGGAPMLGRGVVYRQAKSGAWVKAPGADVLLDTFDAFGGREWRYRKWARTDASGEFLMSVPLSTEGLGYRVRTPATSTHLKATSTQTRSVCF